MRKKPLLLFASCACLFSAILQAADPAGLSAQPGVFPGRDWAQATPESQGLDPARLKTAVELLDKTIGSDGARELVIIRNGRMIWKGANIDKVHGAWSLTKSFTSTVLGLLIEDGKCSLDSKAAEFVPELASSYPDVSLRHFTTMTSGYRGMGDEPKGTYLHGPSSTPFAPNPKPLFVPPGRQVRLLGLSHERVWPRAYPSRG